MTHYIDVPAYACFIQGMGDSLHVYFLGGVIVGLFFLLVAVRSLRRRRPLRLTLYLLLSVSFIAVAIAFGGIVVATRGYQALTREDLVATVRTEPTQPHRFRAYFHFVDGSEREFDLAGEELYVDAHILKWRPLANFFGLHTAYELDRVAGRYRNLADEQQAPRTVFSVGESKPIDLFSLRQHYAWLAPLLDAEYGSATFITADRPRRYEIRISTTGLLARPLEP